MRQEIENLSANQMLKSSTEDLCDYFVAKYTVEVLTLIEERIVADQREKEIDVSNDPGRYWSSPGPHLLRGTEISVSIPFTGDRSVFFIRPSHFALNPPSAQINDSDLTLREAGIDLKPDQVRADVDSTLNGIKWHLANLKPEIDAYNGSLRQVSRTAIEARKALSTSSAMPTD